MSERVLGVTPPISTALPTENEKRSNDALFKELKAQGTFETPSETQKREHVLNSLKKITNQFVKRAAQQKEPKNTMLIRDARGRVFTYGSYRLGVYGPGSDIDTLVVAPKYVTEEQYFDIFPDLLKEMAPPGAITDLTPVRDAFVPIIKFEYDGISIDLIFCSIQTHRQLPDDPDWNLQDNGLLRGLGDKEVRSLNGTRVTDEILNLVPEPATFRLALRAIKLWAQRKAIYANVMGYPGGVAWAMLVARVCQLYPKATSALIVDKFFNIMLKWPWPLPVLLKDIEYNSSVTRVAVWNPKLYASDRNHRMPIITPAYPSMCATHNIGKSSMSVIQQELRNGAALTHEIMVGRRPWKDLFAKHTFFTAGFKYYLTVVSSSRTKEAQNIWSGLVESKVRHLVTKLEFHPSIALARPFNKGFDRVHLCKGDAQVDEVQRGSLAYLTKEADDEVNGTVEHGLKAETEIEKKRENGAPFVKAEDTEIPGIDPAKIEAATNMTTKTEDGDAKVKMEDVPAKETEYKIYTTNHYIGIQLVEKAKSLDLSREVNEFTASLETHDLYDPLVNCLAIQHVKSWELPDDVFEPGEVKPARPIKKKRPAADSDSNPPAKRQQTMEPAA
ncbi:Poly(A) polymerase central domain-containing protein [Podospora appendiculata]|uniref:Poly(A) polymerase n=1 Tax=Podospora appendiculata TaxID=314037 RepID=A0AAE0XEX1_9PEZI|nr:Poly(A) polymerase central domain-containing protein [Podospora appendiculata]